MDSSRPLRDAPDRSYVHKLERFARFAEPELKRVFADLALPPGAVGLDLGCGAGLATACHRAYRERYGLELEDTAGIRGLVRFMAAAGFESVAARTHVVERVQPLREADRDYFRHAIFEGAWGPKVLPFLSPEERARLHRNCDAGSPEYCLDRRDFHHVQTLTVCEGRIEP